MVWQRLIQRLTRTASTQSPRPRTRRRLTIQGLCKREVMATDLAAISGIAFLDADGNGTQNGTEAALAGVRVELFRDGDGNNTIDGADALVGTAVDTIVGGQYRFTGLDGSDATGATTTGRYLLRFSDAPGGPNLAGLILPPITPIVIGADTGVTQQIVDAFTTAQPLPAVNQAAVGTISSSSADLGAASGVLGNERDLRITVLSNTDVANSTSQVSVNTAQTRLSFSNGVDSTASLLVQYDGVDADGAALARDPIGLRNGGATGVNLSNGDSAAGLQLAIRADAAITNGLIVRVFTDANNFSVATVNLPNNLADVDPQLVFVPFSSFTQGVGATGPAVFTNVGAIEAETDSTLVTAGLDLILQVLRTERSNETTINAAVIQPLVLGGEIFVDNGGGTSTPNQNNGIRDAGEPDIPASPADPIEVQLFALTDLNDTVALGDTPIATTTVTGGGTSGAYSFTTLTNGNPVGPGTYAVVIPASQFSTGQPLFGFIGANRTVGYTNADNNLNTNNDGAFVAGIGLVSGAITLVVDGEPDAPVDGTGINDNRTVDFGVLPTTDLRITKTLVPAASSLIPGGNAAFDLVVQNLGPLGATTVNVEDFIPAGLTFATLTEGGTPVATVTTTEVGGAARQIRTFTVGTLAANATRTFRLNTTISGTITADPTNEARVRGFEVEVDNDPNNPANSNPLLNNVSTANVDVPLTTITVTKSDGLTTVNAGSTVTYTITVANTTADQAINVVALDTLPVGVTVANAVFTTGTGTVDLTNNGANNGIIRFLFGDLTGVGTAGATETVTITVNVPPDFVAAPSQLSNTVNVTANNAPPVNANDVTTVARLTDVQTTKTIVRTRVPDSRANANGETGDTIVTTGPFTLTSGGFITYRIQATNVGPSEARGVTITDVLPAGLTLVPGSFSAGTSGVTVAQAGQTLTFTVPNLDPDNPAVTTDDVFFTFEVGIASGITAAIANTSTIATTDPESNSTNNTSTVTQTPVQRLDLILNKDVNTNTAVPGTPATGGTALTYTFTVSHDVDSLSDATNVDVTDILPAGLTNVTISAPGSTGTPTFNTTTRAVLVEYAAIPVGETRVFTITANIAPDVTTALVNTATVVARNAADTAVTTEIDATNNTSTETVNVTPRFDLTVAKSVVGNTTLAPNATVTFNLLVAHDTNDNGTEADDGQSPSRATGVVVTDTLPTGLVFQSATSGGTAVTPTSTTNGVIVFPAFTLDPGATRLLTVVATVSPTAVAGTLNNVASLVTAVGETETTNNSSNVDVTITQQSNLTVTKTVSQTTAATGTRLTYTVTVNNAGPSAAAAVTAVDTLPTGVTFVSGLGPNSTNLTAVNGVVTVNGGTVASGGSFQFTILADINAGVTANQVNSVTVSTTTPESNTNDNNATATTTIDQAINQITGVVFTDRNRNGLQDAGELGVAGVNLRLTGGGLTVPRTTTTNATGNYTFDTLPSGTYVVQRLSLPAETADGLEQLNGGTPTQLGDDIDPITVGGGTVARPNNNFAVVPIISKRRFLRSFYDA